MSKDKKKKPGEVTRRQFLAGTGIVVGGAAIGGTALLVACGGEGTTETVTQTATQTVTTTQQVGTATVTTTATETVSKFVCPYDSQEFSSLSALQTHMDAAHPGETVVSEELTTLTVNGTTHQIKVQPNWTLAFVLREKLHLTGTKVSCDLGACGLCTVLMDGELSLSCLALAIECGGKDILTIEGLGTGDTLDPIQEAFIEQDAMQCGYCIPGAIMTTKWLLDRNPSPTTEEIDTALSGVLCRCGVYPSMRKAVMEVI